MPAILASNHLSYADWLFMPLTLAAPGHLRGQGGVLQHARASRAGSRSGSSPAPVRCPIDRSGASAAEGALTAAKRVLDDGELFGIYPEGTRSHDGRLYRGKTGVARLALRDAACR